MHNEDIINQAQNEAIKYFRGVLPETRELNIDDIYNINLRKEQLGSVNNKDPKYIRAIINSSIYGVSVVIEGKVAFSGGILPMWEGVAEGWLLVDEQFPQLFKRCPRAIIQGTKKYFSLIPITRIQTPVRADFEIGKRFVESLGFENEGLMKKFGIDGSDYYRYALIKGED